MPFLPEIPGILAERGGAALEWPVLRARVATAARSPLGRAWVEALEPSVNQAWIAQNAARIAEMRRLVASGGSFGVPRPLRRHRRARAGPHRGHRA